MNYYRTSIYSITLTVNAFSKHVLTSQLSCLQTEIIGKLFEICQLDKDWLFSTGLMSAGAQSNTTLFEINSSRQ